MQEKPLKTKSRTWAVWIVVISAIIGLTLFAGYAYSSVGSLSKGWTNYPGGQVSALAIDRQGRVWVAYQFSTDSSKNITMYSLEGEPVEIQLPGELAEGRGMSTLAIDRQDRVWVGSWNGRVGMLDTDDQWIIYKPISSDAPPPEVGNPVWDIVFDVHGRAWVRCGYGMSVIDPVEIDTNFEYLSSALPNYYASAITIDEKGQLWARFKNNVKTLETNDHWKTVYSCQGDCPAFTGSALAIGARGQVWVGTAQGISVLAPDGTWQSHALGNTESVNEVSSILIDNQDSIWVGTTRQGLFRYDPNSGWTTYLAGYGVNALALDSQRRLWIGTDTGLRVIDVEAASASQTVQPTQRIIYAVLPSVVLAGLLAIGWAIVFTRNGALTGATFRDFFIGFFGWFIVGALYWGGISLIGNQMGPAALALWVCFIVPLPVTIRLLVVLNKKMRWSALGVVSAIVVNAIGLILSAPPVTDPYYHFPIFEIIMMMPFFINSSGF